MLKYEDQAEILARVALSAFFAGMQFAGRMYAPGNSMEETCGRAYKEEMKEELESAVWETCGSGLREFQWKSDDGARRLVNYELYCGLAAKAALEDETTRGFLGKCRD